jgi:hypothetical protein
MAFREGRDQHPHEVLKRRTELLKLQQQLQSNTERSASPKLLSIFGDDPDAGSTEDVFKIVESSRRRAYDDHQEILNLRAFEMQEKRRSDFLVTLERSAENQTLPFSKLR